MPFTQPRFAVDIVHAPSPRAKAGIGDFRKAKQQRGSKQNKSGKYFHNDLSK
jgi:hypothetical protein